MSWDAEVNLRALLQSQSGFRGRQGTKDFERACKKSLSFPLKDHSLEGRVSTNASAAFVAG